MRTLCAALTLASLGCAGAGRFGYARSYSPLDDERAWLSRTDEAIYDDVRRNPDAYRERVVDFFGVVTEVQGGRGGEPSRVALQIRTHQPRHLCADEAESTCRVTVSASNGGPFTALVPLRDEDTAGENRVQVNSLLRVYGTVVQGEYDANGGPVLRASYYRHWPRGEYVTTANAGAMRR